MAEQSSSSATSPNSSSEGHHTLSIELEGSLLDELAQSARERELQPAELVQRWIRERLAHERERRPGRARPQRPAGEA